MEHTLTNPVDDERQTAPPATRRPERGAAAELLAHYRAVRGVTASLAAPLSAEDQMVQSCPEASPAKWHQAHTTWFFETFVLTPNLPDYRPFRAEFRQLFNSYYNALGNPPDKASRATLSRPPLEEVLAFRAYVDKSMEVLLGAGCGGEAQRRVVLGLHHEQQHQELMLTDIKHAFFSNPFRPAYRTPPPTVGRGARNAWQPMEGGLVEIGYAPRPADALDFCFDNETPRHRAYLESFHIATQPVSCREYLEFITEGGYTRPEFWLAEGWDAVRRHGWRAPLYWEPDPADPTRWRVFTLHGVQPLSALLDTAVCHVSYFEADAFAKWRGCRLPTEQEWELAAAANPTSGNFLDTGRLHPGPAPDAAGAAFLGDCWAWTASAYSPYPRYNPPPGALGEYNGKFMSGQMVLRGGSCLTPASHIRPTYRNFFHPATRWQFAGIRLAADWSPVR